MAKVAAGIDEQVAIQFSVPDTYFIDEVVLDQV
jgi:hypothetical protein